MNCPNGHGELFEQDETHLVCQTCGYSFAQPKRTVKSGGKHIETVNLAIRDMLLEARMDGSELPWERPWIVVPKRNYDTNRRYNGINRWLLSLDPEISYLTEDSIRKHGFDKGDAVPRHVVVFVPPSLTKAEKALSKAEQAEIMRKKHWFSTVHRVYRAKDVAGLPEKQYDGDSPIRPREDIESFFQETIKKMGLTVEVGGNSAVYDWAGDVVLVPRPQQFNSVEEFERARWHEIAHATGAESRLNRDGKKYQRKEDYGREELIAEFASAYICQKFGIPVVKNTTAYIDHWLKAIDGDAHLLVSAAQQAEKVLAYLGIAA